MTIAVYDRIGRGDAAYRRPDPRMERSTLRSPSSRSITGPISRPDWPSFVERLATDLRSGEWARRYGHLLERETLDVGLRIVS